MTAGLCRAAEASAGLAAVLAASPLPNLGIPATLHASLIARLDRLGPVAKEVGKIGAVIGREFGYELIEQVAQRPSAELLSGLDRLAEAGLLFCRGVAPRSSYLSSTRWCRTPPTAPCCGRGDKNYTPASRQRCSSILPILSSASPNSWLIT